MNTKEQDFTIELHGDHFTCGSEIYIKEGKRPLIILKNTLRKNLKSVFTNYIRSFAIEAQEKLDLVDVENVIWGMYYPNNMHIGIAAASLCVVSFQNTDHLQVSFSRSISREDLSRYSGYTLKKLPQKDNRL
jgi:hypothetical protein